MAIFVRELVRPTYACRSCESQGHDPQIAKPALPPEPIPKSGIGAGLFAHVIVSKCVDHLPLNRQESILARHGWDVRRSTRCDHLQKCGELLTPLYDLMHRRLLKSFAIHADDTPLLLLRPRRTGYAWVCLGDAPNPYTLFDLTAGRSQTFPQRFLEGFRGFIRADAYARFGIDNGDAERDIRPLTIGRANWLHVGDDGGLKTASVLLSICASATRHNLNPWSYLRDVLGQLASRSNEANVSDLLRGAWASGQVRTL
jgi:hypothetical protein